MREVMNFRQSIPDFWTMEMAGNGEACGDLGMEFLSMMNYRIDTFLSIM